MPVTMTGGWLQHTYVETDSGLKWGCGGRFEGGSVVDEAEMASLAGPVCHARPEAGWAPSVAFGDVHAGIAIVWSLEELLAGSIGTGTCHQIANRILEPASISIAGVKGWTLSHKVFGLYGIGDWPEREHCASMRAKGLCEDADTLEWLPAARERSPPAGDEPVKEAKPSKRLIEEVRHTFARHGHRSNAAAASEIAAMLALSGIEDLGQDIRNELIEAHVRFRQGQETLLASRTGDERADREIARKLGALRRSAFETDHRLLGPVRFEKMYGLSLDQLLSAADDP